MLLQSALTRVPIVLKVPTLASHLRGSSRVDIPIVLGGLKLLLVILSLRSGATNPVQFKWVSRD